MTRTSRMLLIRFPQIILRELGLITPADWISRFGPERSWLAYFFGDRLEIVLIALTLAGILALLGQNRKDYFLALGHVNAPAVGMRLPWKIAGPIIALALIALTTAAILAMNPFPDVTFGRVIALLPAILILALMKAFGEELAYRAAPLSTRADCWQATSLMDDRIVVRAGALLRWDFLWCIRCRVFHMRRRPVWQSNAATRGLTIPVFMHLLGDVVLYAILALGSA